MKIIGINNVLYSYLNNNKTNDSTSRLNLNKSHQTDSINFGSGAEKVAEQQAKEVLVMIDNFLKEFPTIYPKTSARKSLYLIQEFFTGIAPKLKKEVLPLLKNLSSKYDSNTISKSFPLEYDGKKMNLHIQKANGFVGDSFSINIKNDKFSQHMLIDTEPKEKMKFSMTASNKNYKTTVEVEKGKGSAMFAKYNNDGSVQENADFNWTTP